MMLPILSVWPVSALPATIGEYRIKAAFLYNFAKFVDWPPAKAGHEKLEFKIGILGDNPFGTDIDVVKGKRIRGLPLKILQADSLSELGGCQIIFLSANIENELKTILEQLQSRPVLTVSDKNGFANRGVIINLVKENNKIRFQINPAAADRAGLKISSHLLRLAHIVE
jgi:hypothetical protein